MRKKIFGKQLGRNRNSRKALFRSLIRALVLNGKIKTTKTKAKAIDKEIAKIMNLMAKESLASRRQVIARLGNDKETVKKLFSDYLPLAKNRKSGFVRKTNLLPRKGDNAPMVLVEWLKAPKSK